MRNEMADDSDQEDLPYTELDHEMRMLQIDITFECSSYDNP